MLIILDLNSINSEFRTSLETDLSRNSIQTIYSQVANWFLKGNLDYYKDNKKLFYLDQIEFAKKSIFSEIDDLIIEINSSRLTSLPSVKPEYLFK